MFKATFPWAKASEELAERQYLKSFDDTGRDEVAGNVWIPEKFGTTISVLKSPNLQLITHLALELAEEYGITRWILALLDPSEVTAVHEDKSVNAPPKFVFSAENKLSIGRASGASTTTTKGRGRKAGSPVKSATSAGAAAGAKSASPKKRTTKAVKEANAAAARQASENLQAVLATTAKTASIADSNVTSEAAELQTDEDAQKAIVSVKTAVEVSNGVETTHTNVQVKLPPGSPELPLGQTTEEMIEQAKAMVEAAAKIEGVAATPAAPAATTKKGKRKAETLDAADAEDAATGSPVTEVVREVHVAKRPRLHEQEVRRQKVRTRALVGVAASIAIGYVFFFLCFEIWPNMCYSAIVPYVLGG